VTRKKTKTAMNSLTVEQVLKEKKTNDPDSVKELNLGHKALTDVSIVSVLKLCSQVEIDTKP